MSKVYKATVYFTDTMDQIDGKERFKSELETTFERSYLGSADLITDIQESREFEWDDDIDLNRIDAEKEVYEKYFEKECSRCTLSLVSNNNLEPMYVPRYCSDCGRKL